MNIGNKDVMIHTMSCYIHLGIKLDQLRLTKIHHKCQHVPQFVKVNIAKFVTSYFMEEK